MAGQRQVVQADVDSAAFERGLKQAIEGLVVTSEDEAKKYAYKIRNVTTRYTPVNKIIGRGGDLKAAWAVVEGHDAEGWYVAVVNHMNYAAYVEMGTSKMAAQPMIRPAIAEVLGVQGLHVKIIPTWSKE